MNSSLSHVHVYGKGYEPICSGECKRKINEMCYTNILMDFDVVVMPVKIYDDEEILLGCLLCL